MEDESDSGTLKLVKMGADNNPSSTSRLFVLQSRKQVLEEKIAAKNKELRRLCIQEAELTGVMPAEIPLEPGEPIPTFRRRVGTAFEFPQNVINSLNTEDETIPSLETKIQVQKKIVEAAFQVANNASHGKSIRRKNMSIYRQKKQQLEFMEERLENLKLQTRQSQSQIANATHNQLKQKKKPRPALEADTISTKSSNPSQHEDINLSRSSQSLTQKETHHLSNTNIDADRYILTNKYNTAYKNSNQYLLEGDLHNANIHNYHNVDDNLVPIINRLSINNSYTSDRRSTEHSSSNPYMSSSYPHSHSNPNIYQQQQQQQHNMYISNTHTLPHIQHSSPNQYQNAGASHPNLNFPVHAHTLQYPSSKTRCAPDDQARKYIADHYRNGYTQDPHHPYYSSQSLHHMVQISPNAYKYNTEPNVYNNALNNHQILAHQQQQQQYELEMSLSPAGLGGHWFKTENGEMIWCPTLQHDAAGNTWQSDKRFGSLDRRKGKHINHKRTSPNLDIANKQCAMRPVMNTQQEYPRPMTMQSVPSSVRSSRHDRQLVRTQSLGSVGAHTVDSVWPSDDNSSYDSDGHSINELNANSRKLKQKGWCETSLDGPISVSNQPPPPLPPPQHSVITEEVHSPPQIHLSPVPPHPPHVSMQPTLSPRTPKPILEIPAESNPSPIVETNMELFNNNVLTDLPKNCTVVQAGQCKPYREVTKPFEMSDFYKYSTKYRNQEKATHKPEIINEMPVIHDSQFGSSTAGALHKNDSEDNQEDVYQKGVYQPLQPMKCQPLTPTNSFNRSFSNVRSPDTPNTSLDTSLVLNQSSANVAEHFSAEMNAWYQSQGHTQNRLDGNNASTSPISMGRSAATLV